MNDQTKTNQRNLATTISGMARRALVCLLISRVLVGQTTNTSSSFVTLCPSVYYPDTIVMNDRSETEDNSHGISQFVLRTSHQGYRRIHYRVVICTGCISSAFVIDTCLIVRESRINQERKVKRAPQIKCSFEIISILMLNLLLYSILILNL